MKTYGRTFGAISGHGMLEIVRAIMEFIHSELERIVKYGAKGDLVSPLEALHYLRQRDQA